MIPVEYLWLTLIAVFAIIGMVRGLWKEMGVTTVMLLTLFVLMFSWEQIGSRIVTAFPGQLAPEEIKAIYFSAVVLFMAFIAYEGITLVFPLKQMKGISKAIFGWLGGLLNGYLVVGTIWNVVNDAAYFGLEVPMGSSGVSIAISDTLTELNNVIVQYLPVTFLNEYILLLVGMILLVIIILK